MAAFQLPSSPLLVLIVWAAEVGGPSGIGPTTEEMVQGAGPATREMGQGPGPGAEGVLPMSGVFPVTGEEPAAVTLNDAGDAGKGEELGTMVGVGKGGGGM